MKYAPSALGVGELRNKAGSVVASRNRFGAYLRNRVTPVNPNTTKQASVRSNFQQLSSNWRSLTAAQRLAWANLGAQILRTDKLGQDYTLTGLQAYMSCNRNLETIGSSPISAAPATYAPVVGLQIPGITIDISSTLLEVEYLPDPVPADTAYIIEATGPVSPGRNYFGPSEFKYLATVAATSTSPFNAWAEWTAIFGLPIAGQKVAVRMKPIKTTTGFEGAYDQVTAIVVA